MAGPPRPGIVGAAAVALAVLLAWLAWPERAREAPAVRGAARAGPAPAARGEPLLPPAAPLRSTRGEPAPVDPAPAGTPAAAPATIGFRGRFVRADRVPLEAVDATVVLAGADGRPHEVEVRAAAEARIDGLPPGVYTAHVTAAGYHHRAQVFDLSSPADLVFPLGGDPAAELCVEERLYLWPARWIAVVVLTPDGRPFGALATDLGWEPRQLFVGAFDARARLDPPGPDAWSHADAATFATWRRPAGHQAWGLPGSCVGSLELREDPPLWVGLQVLGVPLGWELVPPEAVEATFRLDGAAIAARLARFAVRVVDAAGGAPLSGALVTLRPHVSALRRAELVDVPAPADGRVVLERLVPGEYELSITHAGAIHQDRLVLGPGENRNLGAIPLAAGAPFLVRVLDADGDPAGAWIEIGPYRTGAAADALYPPMLSRVTDARGEHWLPRPTGRSIVRATVFAARGHYPTDVRSANVLVDPAALPAGPLEITVHAPIAVVFETGHPAGRRIEIADALELLVASPAVPEAAEVQVELAPGRYRARLLDGGGRLLAERGFALDREPLRLSLP
ncbi:MAG: carboxypeptidase-like regulatory domain-containing protein [Planctomycetota bacterium]